MTTKPEKMVSLFNKKTEEEKERDRSAMLLSIMETRFNQNNFSYWYRDAENISKNTFSPIDTFVLDFPMKYIELVYKEKVSEKDEEELGNYILDMLPSYMMKHEKLFMKTNVFSDKFFFNNPLIENIREITASELGQKAMNLAYSSLLIGAGLTTELVIREYIEPDESIGKIYEGMPLNTEFRFFVDFTEGKVIGVSNYWEPETMFDSLSSPLRGVLKFEDRFKFLDLFMSSQNFNDYLNSGEKLSEYENKRLEELVVYLSNEERIVSSFEEHHKDLAKIIQDKISNLPFRIEGKWSLDIMLSEDKFYLIDMALMNQSALVDKMIPLGEES